MDFEPLKRIMEHFTEWRMPGNAASVWMDGKEVFSYSSGYADLENKIPMTPQHLLYIYSCSKVATVTAALQLYEQGKFLLDDPLYAYIPEYKEMHVKDGDGLRKAENPITMRHLFTMTTGFTYDMTTPSFDKARKLTNGRMDTLTVAKCFAEEPLQFEPGTQWLYSLSHDVLAAAVEVISGKRFSKYVQENIFDPLGMTKSCYHANEDVLSRMAEQYEFVDGSTADFVEKQKSAKSDAGGVVVNYGKKNGYVFGEDYDSGGAGIVTDIGDYAKFAAALAGGGKLGNERILSSGTVELLRTSQICRKEFSGYDWNVLKGYGYGLGVRTMINKAESGSTGNVGEFGWCGAAGGMVIIDPELKLSMFYAHHMLNSQEDYYMPRIRNVLYNCINR